MKYTYEIQVKFIWLSNIGLWVYVHSLPFQFSLGLAYSSQIENDYPSLSREKLA